MKQSAPASAFFRSTLLMTILLTVAGWQTGQGQTTVRTDMDPETLVKEHLIGRGIMVRNVRFTGAKASLGYFEGALFEEGGIVISTGQAADMAGPNDKSKVSSLMGTVGDRHLSAMADIKTFDAAVLEFDFKADRDSINFHFIYASDGYNENVRNTFQDPIGVILSGPGAPNGINYGTIPGSETPINLNTLNAMTNARWYVDNNPYDLAGNVNDAAKGKLNPELLQTVQYDGMSRKMTVGVRIKPNTVYHLKLMIADAGDGQVDSALLLEGKSLESLEQWKHERRRRELAEIARQDSIARAQALADSLEQVRLIEEARQDSLRALEGALDGMEEGENGNDEAEEEAADENGYDRDEEITEVDEVVTDMEVVVPEQSEFEAGYLVRIPYPEGGYFLTEDSEQLVRSIGSHLLHHPELEMVLYGTEDADMEVTKLRIDMVRMEVLKMGVNPDRVIRAGVHFLEEGEQPHVELSLRKR